MDGDSSIRIRDGSSERHSSSSPGPPKQNLKRRLDDHKVQAHEHATQKRRRRKSGREADPNVDIEGGLNLAIAKMDSNLLADHIAQKSKRLEPDLSLVELEDRRLPGCKITSDDQIRHADGLLERYIYDASTWSQRRSLENLPKFLETYTTNNKLKAQLRSASSRNGSPHTLVVTSAGLRAADISRYVSDMYLSNDLVQPSPPAERCVYSRQKTRHSPSYSPSTSNCVRPPTS